MKKLFFILFLLFSTPVLAADDPCANIGELANLLMEVRQANGSAQVVMNQANGNKLVKAMIIDAFKEPVYHTKAYKDKAVSEFTNKWYMFCVAETTF